MPRRSSFDQGSLERLALEQDGGVSRGQLSRLGADRHVIAHPVRTSRWTTIGPRVVVLMTGTLTFRQRLWVACLHSGPASALAALTAAEAYGLRGFPSPVLHTVVPHGSDATALRDVRTGARVRVSQRRDLSAEMVHRAGTPRLLLLPHAVVDSAAEAPTPDRPACSSSRRSSSGCCWHPTCAAWSAAGGGWPGDR